MIEPKIELPPELNQLSRSVIGAAIEVHRSLGPGLLESAYELFLCRELDLREIHFQRQLSLPVEYKGVSMDGGYRIDLLIENNLIVELKTVETILPIHEAQLLTYLKLLKKPFGLLINFNMPVLRDGIKRRICSQFLEK